MRKPSYALFLCPPPLLTITPFPHLNAPLSAAVESDTVGYTTIEMQAGKWYQIGTPFVELKEGTVPTLNTVFTEGFSDGDAAFIYDATTGMYSSERRWSSALGEPGWYIRATLERDTQELPMGQAVFFHKQSSTSKITVKGKVSAQVVVEFGSENGDTWAQIAPVYPAERSLNEMEWENVGNGDSIFIYDSESGRYIAERRWATIGGVEGWYDRATLTLDNQKLPVGQALFIHKATKGVGLAK